MSVGAGGPEADRAQERRIVFWHARAHDKLDTYGIPRFEGSMELMLEERIDRFAQTVGADDKPTARPPLGGPTDT